MHFITETELRAKYKTQPFIDFKLPPETRLTPGARQFLLDRGVNLYDKKVKNKKDESQKDIDKVEKIKPKKFIRKIKLIQADTLLCGANVIESNLDLAQEISKISNQLSSIIKFVDTNLPVQSLECKPCTGICDETFSQDLGDCFEINEFHIQVENGKNIILLHKLRLLFREFYEDLDDYSLNADMKEQIEKWLQQIINTISRLVCAAYGSKKCQRS